MGVNILSLDPVILLLEIYPANILKQMWKDIYTYEEFHCSFVCTLKKTHLDIHQ